jgi:hypothetical protein
MKQQVIYELADVDPDDGVDIFEIAPVLIQFGTLVRNANTVLDLQLHIDIKVKPFREGSWITEFVLHGGLAHDLLALLKSDEAQGLGLLLALLGLDVRSGYSGVAKIVRFTRGRVGQFKRNDNQTITYINDEGQELTVTMPEHRLVQSPMIQLNYYNAFILPLDRFPTATAVCVSVDGSKEAQRFTDDDKESFDEYLRSALPEDEGEDNVTQMHGVYLKPKRGSCSGQEQEYSFYMGNVILYPVAIEDDRFLEQLRSGDIRPYAADVLKVDVEIRQKRKAKNRVTTQYAITRLIEYSKYERPTQYSFGDLEGSGEDGASD